MNISLMGDQAQCEVSIMYREKETICKTVWEDMGGFLNTIGK